LSEDLEAARRREKAAREDLLEAEVEADETLEEAEQLEEDLPEPEDST
jgi:hypothetical protein